MNVTANGDTLRFQCSGKDYDKPEHIVMKAIGGLIKKAKKEDLPFKHAEKIQFVLDGGLSFILSDDLTSKYVQEKVARISKQ